MKKKPIIISVALLGYVVAFLVVRLTHPASETAMAANAQGEYHPQTSRATVFLSRDSGFSRLSSHTMFAVFYPMGQLDRLITGRRYLLVDQRDAPVMTQ